MSDRSYIEQIFLQFAKALDHLGFNPHKHEGSAGDLERPVQRSKEPRARCELGYAENADAKQ